ncbi:MAG: DUF3575 domain-containing protein [Tidjanibacter sp.]|jgi:hypothetical protein|nr:DUF3575 domain-containing protein [Tidjanibacter sp.]
MKKLVVLALSLFAAVTVSNAQVCALKSNALALGIGSVNMAAEFSVAPQWTVELSGMGTIFSPWKNGGEGLYLNGWSAVAEGRYYLCKAFNGHHFGAFGEIARYGKGGNIPFGVADAIYDNVKIAGLGVSYGYYFKLSTYWGIDTNIGIGGGLGTTEGLGKWVFKPVGRAQVSVCYKF